MAILAKRENFPFYPRLIPLSHAISSFFRECAKRRKEPPDGNEWWRDSGGEKKPFPTSILHGSERSNEAHPDLVSFLSLSLRCPKERPAAAAAAAAAAAPR